MAIQLVIFEVAIVGLSWYYDVWSAAIAGTVVVFVATIGSAEMLRISTLIRRIDVPPTYRALLFASNVEVVLSVLAYVALLTHLFVFDPQVSSMPLLDQLFGSEPPVLVVYLTLLILWDVSYRIGTAGGPASRVCGDQRATGSTPRRRGCSSGPTWRSGALASSSSCSFRSCSTSRYCSRRWSAM